MPDGLYDRDALFWSEQQSALLRRLAAGERVNDAVDWTNVIEEVETVGRSELRACESLLTQAMLHLMKLHASPDSPDVPHWRAEVAGFLADALRSFTPSMRQRIDVTELYADALYRYAAQSDAAVPAASPFQLDDLLARHPRIDTLVARMGTP